MAKITFNELSATPTPPDSGLISMYAKTDGVVYVLSALGVETAIGSADGITSLTGDVTGTGPGAAATVVISVGGQSAANIATATLLANAATPANTFSEIVRRDSSGNFVASTITANLNGNAATATSSLTSVNWSGSLGGDVNGTQSTTVVISVGGSSAANIHAAEILANAATSANTGNQIVRRDASGNFAAAVITANLIGNVTGNASGSAASFTGSLAGDVTGTQGATAIASTVVTGKLLTGYVVGSNIALSATDSILQAFEKLQGQIGATVGSSITSLTGDVTATGPGAAAATVTGIQGFAVTNSVPSDTQILVWNSTASKYQLVSLSSDASMNHSGAVTVLSVGGSSAANIHSAEVLANAATASNTASQIVRRDSSGNFVASTITANLVGNVTGAASLNVLKSGDTMTGALTINVLSADALLVGANTLVVDTNDNRVGINQPTPAQALDVIGNGLFSGTVTASNVSGSNTGDITILNTNSIHLTLTGQQLSANLQLSSDAADVSSILASVSIHANGLFVEVPVDVPVQIGTSNGVGSSPSGARADHVHAHGNQTSPTLHAVATETANGFMSAADKTKLDTISPTVGTDAQILISNGTVFAPQTVSGDITLTDTGVTTISVGAVTDTKASLANKPAVAVVATANIGLSGFQTIDGVTTADNTLVLCTAQTTPAQNGPWQAHVGAWTRPSWYPTGGTTQSFQFITTLVRLGTTYAGSVWRQTTAAPITIDTTPTTWVTTRFALSASTVTGILPNANTTADSADTANAIVTRDASGNFAATMITSNLTGNVTGNVSGSSSTFTGSLAGDVAGTQSATLIQANVVSNSKLAQMAAHTLKGNNTGATANPSDLSVANVAAMLLYVTTVGAIDGNGAAANGLSIDAANNIYAQSASVSAPGMVNISTQSFAGNKTFTGTLAVTNTALAALSVNSTDFVVDGTNHAVGIGTAPATNAVLDIVNSSGVTKGVQVTGYGSNVGFRGRQAAGTIGSPSATVAGTTLTFFSGRGYGTSAFAASSTGIINIVADETFSTTSMATYISFSTTPTTTTTSSERMRINSTGRILVGTTTDNGVELMQINGGMVVTGSAGSGYTGHNSQSAAPGTPTSGFRLFSDSIGRFAWKGTNGFVRTFDGSANTADRIYVLPDTNDQIATAQMTTALKTAVVALVDGANIATDASKGNTFTVTLAGNRNLSAPTNPVDGQKITYRITQDATGGRTLSFDPVFTFGLDIISVVLSSGANKTDYIGCIYNAAQSKWNVVAVSKGF